MGLRRILSLLLLETGLLCPPPSQARRGDAYVGDVHLAREPDESLVVSFRVHGAMDERVLDTLDSGLPVRFTYWVRIVHPRRLYPDDVLAEVKLTRVLEKDNLEDRYHVILEDNGEEKDLGGLTAAVESMTRVEGLVLGPLWKLGSFDSLELRIKAQLQKFRLPFQLHYLFAFVSYLDVETDWYVFPLPPAAPPP